MTVSSRWHLSRSDAIEKAKAAGAKPCTCKGNRRYPTKNHLRGDNEWQVILPGLPRRSFERKAEAEAWETEQKANRRDGVLPFDPSRGDMLFDHYARRVVHQHYQDANSRRTQLGRLNRHIVPYFTGKTMRDADIQTSTVNAFLAHLRAKPRSTNNPTPLSENTVEQVWTVLGMIMRIAVDVDKIRLTNPCKGITRPKRVRKKVLDTWEPEVVDALLDAVPDQHHAIPLLAAMCGHRQGEAFAVAVQDIQTLRQKITIRHQVAMAEDGTLILKPPKGDKVRTVPLPPEVGQALVTHIQRYGTTTIACTCCGAKKWDLLFTPGGTLLNRWEWNRAVWAPTLTKAGLPVGEGNGLHQLRHAFVSELIAGGADAKMIMTYCGHTSITMTYNIYGHLLDVSHKKAITIMSNRLNRRGAKRQADHG